ncbi:MAG: beta-ketoacyl-ACP synthase II [Paludibacteraceae bacterium]|nr:beta-ketoacyl-ACP synthase II [Paludibacteraceae bacterium]
MNNRRVVITGIGGVCSVGNSMPQIWSALQEGTSGCGEITCFDTTNFKTRFACQVKDFAPACLDRKLMQRTDRNTQFAMASVYEALADSKLDMEAVDKERFGCVWGTGMGGLKTFEDGMMEYGTQYRLNPHFSSLFLPKLIANMPAAQISITFGLLGPNYATVSACASSGHSIVDAMHYIQLGDADIMIAGGSEAAVTEGGIGSFNAMHALSTRNDSPATASRPFSASRDGFVLGEGGAALVLEDYDHAVARGAHIYAELAAAGVGADAYHITAPDPSGAGAVHVMKQAVKKAGLSLSDVDYINTHGTSTTLGDIAEAHAIDTLFGEHAPNINISSTKSMTGHLLGGAGALEAAISALVVENDIVPPTINHADDDVDLQINPKLNFTFNKPQHRTVNVALSNSFGFGGHNVCLLLKKI